MDTQQQYTFGADGQPEVTPTNIARGLREIIGLVQRQPQGVELFDQMAKTLAGIAVRRGWIIPAQVTAASDRSLADAQANIASHTRGETTERPLAPYERFLTSIAEIIEQADPTDTVPVSTSAVRDNGAFTPEQQHVAGIAFGAQPHRFSPLH